MFSNYIRGGQIFLHKMRMLKQVWEKTLLTSFVVGLFITGYFSYEKLSKLDYAAGITYVKAEVAVSIDKIFSNKKPSTISVVTSSGVHNKRAKAKDVLTHPGIKKRYNEIFEAYFRAALLQFWVMLGLFISIIMIWTKSGKTADEKSITKGGKVLSAEEVSVILKKLKQASDFKIGGMPLVKDKETSHILISGTTGSGKSNCMHQILPQVRIKNQSAIIVDFTGEMVNRYYNPERGDVILCPFDKRSHSWDFWDEISEPNDAGTVKNLQIVSKALFTNDNENSDPFWQNSAEVIFQDVVTYLLNEKKKSLSELNTLIAKTDIKTLAKKLIGTYSTVYLDPNNEKTAASIRSTLATSTKSLRYLEESPDKKICLKEWVAEIEGKNHGKWLFLLASPENRELMKPLISMWMDIIVNKIMSLGIKYERRIWIVIDELPALKRLPSLPTALSEFRKYGGCIMAGIQSVNQLYKVYGQYEGLTMLDQFNTKFIFRTEENNFANYICKNFGDIEYTESTENYSYGAHEMRDGVSSSKIEKKKALVNPSDLAALKDCEAYVKLPNYSVRIAKVKMSYVAM